MKKRRMSWGIRLALNLVLLCVLVVFIWGLLGFSSPTLRGRFRRVCLLYTSPSPRDCS